MDAYLGVSVLVWRMGHGNVHINLWMAHGWTRYCIVD